MKKRFNGKPMSHWQSKADELVAENLVRACLSLDRNSIIGELAFNRLNEIARIVCGEQTIDSIYETREQCIKNIQRFVSEISNPLEE